MTKSKFFLNFFIIIFITFFSKLSLSEPFVVLEYRGNTDRINARSDNLFMNDLNHSSKHIVLKNATHK